MSEDERDLSPALEEARQRRADLHHALVEVEQAISGPAAGREQEWTREVVERLGGLRETIEEHIEVTERADGLYDEILHKAPRLAAAVQRLHDEHPQLRDHTSELIRKLRTTPVGTTWSLEDVRDDVQRLLGQIVRHRQRGADLIWEAYNLDIGGVE
jgi:chromosome segregation ATPase